MDFWDSVTEFGEGAWETVSGAAQNAVGDWAYGWSGGDDAQQAQATQTGTTGNTSGTSDDVASQHNSAGSGFAINAQTAMIGGGVLLAVVLLLK
ncbi:hypothetical protein [Aestuariibacter sp. A3R04]|uniref:hypothetical protein n=1 Tax=Aestuariibacter sp. A3R04 TaxID=2841571 RepID=UPI001C09D386|nr:hypothetical protein [Aestuariibacter sp. A3R04]MBU3022874.1 hypothetical protein [Aestuariibacter sp. A3R04]